MDLKTTHRRTLVTKYCGPTDTRGSRIRVTNGDVSMMVPLRPELDSDDNHREAARKLLDKLGWADPEDTMIGAWVEKKGIAQYMVWVFTY